MTLRSPILYFLVGTMASCGAIGPHASSHTRDLVSAAKPHPFVHVEAYSGPGRPPSPVGVPVCVYLGFAGPTGKNGAPKPIQLQTMEAVDARELARSFDSWVDPMSRVYHRVGQALEHAPLTTGIVGVMGVIGFYTTHSFFLTALVSGALWGGGWLKGHLDHIQNPTLEIGDGGHSVLWAQDAQNIHVTTPQRLEALVVVAQALDPLPGLSCHQVPFQK